MKKFMGIPLNLQLFAADTGAGGGGAGAGGTGDQGGAGAGTPQTITIGGVEYTPEQLEAKLNEHKSFGEKIKTLEPKAQGYEKLSQYSQFIEALEADPNLTQTVVNTLQTYQQQGKPATQQQINTIKNAADNATDDSTRSELEDIRLSMEIDKLSTKYDDFDEKAVLEYAVENNIDDLEKAYKLLNYDAHKDAAAKKALEEAKKGSQVPRTQTGGTGAPGGQKAEKPKTFGEAAKAAAEYLASRREQ